MFFKILPPKNPNTAFLVPNLGIFLFQNILSLDKLEGTDFTYGNIYIFTNSSPKIPMSGIFGTKFRRFRFFVKFCKYTNLRELIPKMTIVLFLKFLPKNRKIKNFWPQTLTFLFFRKILQLHKFESGDLKYDNIVSKRQSKNTQIRLFWSQI